MKLTRTFEEKWEQCLDVEYSKYLESIAKAPRDKYKQVADGYSENPGWIRFIKEVIIPGAVLYGAQVAKIEDRKTHSVNMIDLNRFISTIIEE